MGPLLVPCVRVRFLKPNMPSAGRPAMPGLAGGLLVSMGLWTSLGLAGCEERAELARLDTKRVLSEVGTRPGQMAYPRSIDTGPDNIWVIDKSARVQCLDAETGRPLATWFMPRFDRGKPTGITIAPGADGEPALYVADTHEHRVLVFDLDKARDAAETPEPDASFGEYGFGDGQFVYPTDVAVLTDDDGRPARYYVTEYGGNDRVSVWNAEHQFEFSFGVFGDAIDHDQSEIIFNRPQSIVLDEALGELLVLDAGNHRIGRFTTDGELIGWFSPKDERGGALLHYPYGIHVLDGGLCLITEIGSNTLRLVDVTNPESGVLASYGGAGREVGQLATPWGVTVFDGEMYVLDSGNHRVQVAPLPDGVLRRVSSRDSVSDAAGGGGQ